MDGGGLVVVHRSDVRKVSCSLLRDALEGGGKREERYGKWWDGMGKNTCFLFCFCSRCSAVSWEINSMGFGNGLPTVLQLRGKGETGNEKGYVAGCLPDCLSW